MAACKNPEIISRIISKSPDNVIKSICNASLNAAQGQVTLKPKEKKILAANRKLIQKLIQKGESTKKKRQILSQTGGGPLAILIPTVLSAVLSTLGSTLFNK